MSEQVNFLDFPGLSRLVDKIYSKFVKKADIVDGLTSIEAAKPLSAKQGKVLNDGKADKKVPAANGNVATLDSSGDIADGGETVSELTNVIEKIQRNGTDLSSPNKTVNVEVPVLGIQVGGSDITPDANHKVNVPVDNILKDNSVNPVQNKVVFAALRDVARQIIANSRDLSLYDIYGKLWAGRRTANCYVVSRPGTYRIPLAYGSAIKDGADNPAAYTNNGGAYQAAFVNYLGNQITKPCIEEDTGVSAASAELSLADTDSIFTNISLVELDDCKYLVFDVESVPATGANGILSVLDASSNIMWSYHVWIWPDSLKTVEFSNHTGVKYNMLPVNLASKWDDATKAHIRNWHFQWGRKDPMCIPVAYDSSSNATLYGAKTFAATNADTVAEAIKRPHNFFKQYDAVSYNWNPLTYFWNFWDALCNSTGASDNLATAIKTVYDPCPAGFIVPVGRAFTGFTATGENTSESADFEVVGSFSAGWYFKANGDDLIGQFFPASGLRSRGPGGLGEVGSRGYYWSSAAYGQAGAYYLSFYSSLVNPLYGYGRASGFPVRPVRELS